MKRTFRDNLGDIMAAIEAIEAFTQGMTREDVEDGATRYPTT